MKRPTPENIESLMVDWMDGKLNEGEVALVRAFLLAHPELGIDADIAELPVLDPSNDSFAAQRSLIRYDESVEADWVDYIDGTMSVDRLKIFEKQGDVITLRRERTALAKCVAPLDLSIQHPSVAELLRGEEAVAAESNLSAYSIKADTTIVFDGKDLLLKESGLHWVWRAAAAIALIIGLSIFFVNRTTRSATTTTAGKKEFQSKGAGSHLPAKMTLPAEYASVSSAVKYTVPKATSRNEGPVIHEEEQVIRQQVVAKDPVVARDTISMAAVTTAPANSKTSDDMFANVQDEDVMIVDVKNVETIVGDDDIHTEKPTVRTRAQNVIRNVKTRTREILGSSAFGARLLHASKEEDEQN